MTWRHVVEHLPPGYLLVICVADRDPPGEQVAPVRALAAVAGKSLEQGRQRMRLPDRDEVGRVAGQFPAAVNRRADILNVGAVSFENAGMVCSFLPLIRACPATVTMGLRLAHEAFAPSSATS